MKRIIKFREWNGFEMEYEPPISMYSSASINDRFVDSDLMQFTGSFDLNGKEIYEGDIVEIVVGNCEGTTSKDKYEVIYSAPEFKFKTVISDIFKMGSVIYFMQGSTVIGNIYEKR